MFKKTMLLMAALMIAVGGSQLPAQEPLDKPMLPLANASPPAGSLPLSNTPSAKYFQPEPLSFAQQTARYEAIQRTQRLEWYKWIAHSPLRPATNADLFMGDNARRYYLPYQGIIVGNHLTSTWYW
jgi:hypothetical protein